MVAEDPVRANLLRRVASSAGTIRRKPFEVLSEISRVLGRAESAEDEALAQELILRVHEHKELLGQYTEILEALTRQVGLFPYLDAEQLGTADQVAFEAHRPLGDGVNEIVFHRVQADIYRTLLSGRNVVLSAPTSFGKSLIVDALIASRRYTNIVIVVPTIALIDETRRRIARFSDVYKVITHTQQAPRERNVFVLTQERVIDFDALPRADLFVIDEFYKLQPDTDEERSYLLNQAFYKLFKQGGQFYLLGPNVEGVAQGFAERFNCVFIRTDYATVATNTHHVDGGEDPFDALASLSVQLDDPTLIYCASPARVRRAARALINAGDRVRSSRLEAASAWISSNYHSEWLVPIALRHGIGIHHGRIPRALAQFIVRAFNDGDLKTLICTSTLIEGVNTKAKNVIIFDNKIARQKYDYFTFNNIRGRSGRMFQHFVGDVYLFNEPPQESLPLVDVPVLTQDELAPESLLIQMESDDLSRRSQQRLSAFFEQNDLSIETIRANAGIDPERQIALAHDIRSDPRRWWAQLSWSGMPTNRQLYGACDVLWDYFMEAGMTAGIASGKQLAFRLSAYRVHRDLRGFIQHEVENGDHKEIDDAVEAVLEFTRQWAGYRFPRLLMALDRIQSEVFRSLGLVPGSYAAFSSMIENQFTDPALVALEEYGLPVQIGRKLSRIIVADGDLDRALESLKAIELHRLRLDPFELEVLSDVQANL